MVLLVYCYYRPKNVTCDFTYIYVYRLINITCNLREATNETGNLNGEIIYEMREVKLV